MANEEVVESKPSWFANMSEAVRRSWRETFGELRRVHWPTRPDVRNLSTIILAVTAAMAMILGLADFLFDRLFAQLLQAQPNVIALAIAATIVIALVITVVWTSRDQR